MSISYPCICIDRVVPQAFARLANQKALIENPANRPSLEGAALHSKLWRPGRTLGVAFLDGEAFVQAKVAERAAEWCRYANIAFDFEPQVNAELRISFAVKGASWSAVGTDALVDQYYLPGQPTMNFGWLDRSSRDEDYYVVLHEFGHALGLIHEHQGPDAKLRWNRELVLRELAGYPNYWDELTVQRNIFDRYSVSQTQYTSFDSKSIMLYPFPSHWTLDNTDQAVNHELSDMDKEFIASCYPKP